MLAPNDARRHLDTRRILMSSDVSMLGISAGSPGSRIQPEPEPDEGFLFSDANTPHVHTGGQFLEQFEFGGLGAGVDGLVSSRGEAAAAGAALSSPSGWSVEQIGGVVAVAVIVPFIVVSNLLVVVSVVKCKRLQIPTNYFTVSLAAVDIFVALVTPFVIMVEILPVQFSDLVLCLAPNRVLLTACGVSVLTLATIAYDRHTALVSPLEYVSVMTHRKIGLLVALTWLYSTAIVWAPLPAGWYSSAPPRGEALAGGAAADRDAIVACSFKLLHDNAHILFLSAIFGPACVAISVCYFRIYTVARHHARAIAAVESSVQHNLRIRSIMKDAKYSMTLALVIGVFLVLWLPYLTCLLAEVVSSVQFSAWLWNYLTLLAVLNSGLNPWIYAYKNNEFRAAFRKVFKDFCACSLGCGSSAPCFRKNNRRSSTMSDASTHRCSTSTVVTSATFASGSFSRRSRTSSTTCGRLSDVSCSLTAPATAEQSGREDSGRAEQKVEEGGRVPGCLARSDSLSACEARFVEAFPTGGGVAAQRRTSDATEKRVSSLLSADSKAFVADLLSLYLHHSVLHPEVSSSEEDGHNDSVDTEVTTHDLALPVDNLVIA